MQRVLTGDDIKDLIAFRDVGRSAVVQVEPPADQLHAVAFWFGARSAVARSGTYGLLVGSAISNARAAGYEWAEIALAAGEVDDLSDPDAIAKARMRVGKKFRRWLNEYRKVLEARDGKQRNES